MRGLRQVKVMGTSEDAMPATHRVIRRAMSRAKLRGAKRVTRT